MSWDIVLFSSLEQITSVADIDEEQLVPLNFDDALLCYFKNSTQDNNHITVVGDDFEIDFFLDDEPASNKMISIYGEKALYNLIILAKNNNWQIYDSGLDDMIDLNDPSRNGYVNFTNYKNFVITKMEE